MENPSSPSAPDCSSNQAGNQRKHVGSPSIPTKLLLDFVLPSFIFYLKIILCVIDHIFTHQMNPKKTKHYAHFSVPIKPKHILVNVICTQ